MADLNQAINTAVPWILIAVVIGWIWTKFGEPLKSFFNWISTNIQSLFGAGVDGAGRAYQSVATHEIVYK